MRTSNRRARATLAIVAVTLSVLGVVGPIAAATPQNVTLVSSTIFNPDGPNYGTFVATGDAVDQGLICATGSFVDTFLAFAGYENTMKAYGEAVRKGYRFYSYGDAMAIV